MKLIYKLTNWHIFIYDKTADVSIFPNNFCIKKDQKNNTVVEITCSSDIVEGKELDVERQELNIKKEADRIFFLTGNKLQYELVGIEDDDGVKGYYNYGKWVESAPVVTEWLSPDM